jgi:hypothetical protein
MFTTSDYIDKIIAKSAFLKSILELHGKKVPELLMIHLYCARITSSAVCTLVAIH